MNRIAPISRPQLALVAAALSFASVASFAGQVPEGDIGAPLAVAPSTQSTMTREQVRAELVQAREAGLLSLSGEISEPARVLAARQEFNEQQTRKLVAGYQAAHEQAVAQLEEQVRRQTAQADAAAIETAMADATFNEAPLGVQVDVIRVDADANARSDEMVVVSVEGGDPEFQLQRAEAIRSQLIAMGLEPRQIYIEAAGPTEVSETALGN